MMLIRDYQDGTATTAIYRNATQDIAKTDRPHELWQILNLNYCALKLNGEAGEVAEEIAKSLRDDLGVLTDDRIRKLRKEIGDTCWYISQLCNELGFDLETILIENLEKLQDRKERGVLHGSGSDR